MKYFPLMIKILKEYGMLTAQFNDIVEDEHLPEGVKKFSNRIYNYDFGGSKTSPAIFYRSGQS